MKVIYGIGSLTRKGPAGPKAVAVGVFDGVHRGHRLILRHLCRQAKKRGLKSAVVTFSKHPSYFFHPRQKKVSSLTSLKHKLSLIEEEGVDLCYVINFDERLARLEPESFIRDLLKSKIRMVSLYVGEDFVFGHDASGDVLTLEALASKYHFKLHVLTHLKIRGRIVSSTLIRELIRGGDLKTAMRFLGRHVSCLGEVVKGEGRGRSLGFPTANIKPHHEVLVPDGIYITQALWQGGLYPSVSYAGTKPTFQKRYRRRSLEVFLLNFKKSIYNHLMEIRFIKKIRQDREFPSKELLKIQIKKDIQTAERYFYKRGRYR